MSTDPGGSPRLTDQRTPHPQSTVRVTRVFRAPRELVFDAWIDPDQVAAWMAPATCDVPRNSVDVDAHPGGRIHFTQVDRETGAVYPVRFDIVEITRPELLVISSGPQPEIGLPYPMITRVVFEVVDVGDDGAAGTRLTITQGPHTEEMGRDATSGWKESLDKLDELMRR